MEDVKYQSKTVSLPNNTAPGVYETTIQLDSQFTACDGVGVFETAAGGISAYQIGLKDDVGERHANSHKNAWISGIDTPVNERYKLMLLPCNGTLLTIRTVITAALTAQLQYDIVFRLRGRKK